MYGKTRAHGFGPEVKRRIMIGTYALSAGYYDAYYLKAQKVRTLIKQDFLRAFEKVDVLVSPTTPTPAFKAGEREDPLSMYLCDLMTIPVNLAGLPGLSLPCGFANGLPIGLQIIGNVLQESKVLRVAYAYEQSTDWHKRRPPLGQPPLEQAQGTAQQPKAKSKSTKGSKKIQKLSPLGHAHLVGCREALHEAQEALPFCFCFHVVDHFQGLEFPVQELGFDVAGGQLPFLVDHPHAKDALRVGLQLLKAKNGGSPLAGFGFQQPHLRWHFWNTGRKLNSGHNF
jgi:hypothetical protein